MFIKYLPFNLPAFCQHPQHNPPSMIVLEPGTHIWKCPGCGATQSVIVPPKPQLKAAQQLPQFDADLSLNHPDNRRAAAARGLHFDAIVDSYRDVDGGLVRDKFGQPY